MFDKFYSHADGTPSSSVVVENLISEVRAFVCYLSHAETDNNYILLFF